MIVLDLYDISVEIDNDVIFLADALQKPFEKPHISLFRRFCNHRSSIAPLFNFTKPCVFETDLVEKSPIVVTHSLHHLQCFAHGMAEEPHKPQNPDDGIHQTKSHIS